MAFENPAAWQTEHEMWAAIRGLTLIQTPCGRFHWQDEGGCRQCEDEDCPHVGSDK